MAIAMPVRARRVDARPEVGVSRRRRPALVFPIVRLLLCLVVLMLPTAALGATFPFAVRWFVSASDRTGQSAGRLYAANTAGAAIGTLGAGFLLIPAIGVIGTTLVGVGRQRPGDCRRADRRAPQPRRACRPSCIQRTANGERRTEGHAARAEAAREENRRAASPLVGGSAARADRVRDVSATRSRGRACFSSIIGPSTYAFAATVTGIIAGLAVGSAVGSALAGRVRRPELPLAVALAAAALAASWASAYAGAWPLADRGATRRLTADVRPAAFQSGGAGRGARRADRDRARRRVSAGARDCRRPRSLGGRAPWRRLRDQHAWRRSAVRWSAGFVALPILGLQNTLAPRRLDSDERRGGGSHRGHDVAARASRRTGADAVAAGVLFWSPPWDRALLASGGYKYAVHVRRVSTCRRRSKPERCSITARARPAS